MTKIKFTLIEKSYNRTTGPIAVSRTSRESCPHSCPLMGQGCYAEAGGPTMMQWMKVPKIGVDIGTFILKLKSLAAGSLIRLNEAGDLPGDGKRGELWKSLCIPLAKACGHLKCWTYTHYRPNKHNEPILREMNRHLTVNLSANDLATADEFYEKGFDVCLSVPVDYKLIGAFTPKGVRLVGCPEKLGKTDSCQTCGAGNPLCRRKNRDYIICFPAHKAIHKVAAVFNR